MKEVKVGLEERISWTCPECDSYNEHKVCEEANCDVCGTWFKMTLPEKVSVPCKIVYVVNELSEIDVNYNYCHGAFENMKDAYSKAHEIFESAKAEIKNSESSLSELKVYTDDYSVTINVDEVILEV